MYSDISCLASHFLRTEVLRKKGQASLPHSLIKNKDMISTKKKIACLREPDTQQPPPVMASLEICALLGYIPEERRSHQHRGGSLISKLMASLPSVIKNGNVLAFLSCTTCLFRTYAFHCHVWTILLPVCRILNGQTSSSRSVSLPQYNKTCHLLALAHSLLTIEALYPSEMSMLTSGTSARCHSQQDHNMNLHRSENFQLYSTAQNIIPMRKTSFSGNVI
jgi:hypothetical protein